MKFDFKKFFENKKKRFILLIFVFFVSFFSTFLVFAQVYSWRYFDNTLFTQVQTFSFNKNYNDVLVSYLDNSNFDIGSEIAPYNGVPAYYDVFFDEKVLFYTTFSNSVSKGGLKTAIIDFPEFQYHYSLGHHSHNHISHSYDSFGYSSYNIDFAAYTIIFQCLEGDGVPCSVDSEGRNYNSDGFFVNDITGISDITFLHNNIGSTSSSSRGFTYSNIDLDFTKTYKFYVVPVSHSDISGWVAFDIVGTFTNFDNWYDLIDYHNLSDNEKTWLGAIGYFIDTYQFYISDWWNETNYGSSRFMPYHRYGAIYTELSQLDVWEGLENILIEASYLGDSIWTCPSSFSDLNEEFDYTSPSAYLNWLFCGVYFSVTVSIYEILNLFIDFFVEYFPFKDLLSLFFQDTGLDVYNEYRFDTSGDNLLNSSY